MAFPLQNMTLGVKTSTSVILHGTYNVLASTATGNHSSIIVVGSESQRLKLLFVTVSISNLIILRWVHIWIQSLLDLVSMTMGMQMHRKAQCTSIAYASIYSMLDKAECHHKRMLCLLHQGRVFILCYCTCPCRSGSAMNLELALLLAELVQRGAVQLKNQVGAIGVHMHCACTYIITCIHT